MIVVGVVPPLIKCARPSKYSHVVFPFLLSLLSSPPPAAFQSHLFSYDAQKIVSVFIVIKSLISFLFSPMLASTASFVLLAVHVFFILLLHSHIPNASNLLSFVAEIVQVSVPYRKVDHTYVLMSLFLVFMDNFLFVNPLTPRKTLVAPFTKISILF